MFYTTTPVFQISNVMPDFFRTLSAHLGNSLDLKDDWDGFDEHINDLADSFVSFIQGRYIEASEVKFYCQKISILRSVIFLFFIDAHELD
jgi:hypothetical protein